MPADLIELRAGGVKLDNFTSYTVDSDLYAGASAFRFELARATPAVQAGQGCRLYVNGTLEMTGVIDKAPVKVEKSGVRQVVEGRDLMGLLVDSHVEEYVDLTSISVSALALRLLRKVPFISRKAIQFERGRAPGLADFEDEPPHAEPGQSIFEVLRRHAMTRGLLFYCRADGTLVFGKPLARGASEFQLILRLDGRGNNLQECEVVEDFSKRYSKVIVTGQQQGGSPEEINVEATAADKSFPFYKPMVVQMNHDGESPARMARMVLDRQRAEGFLIQGKVKGYGQGARNWSINRLCYVESEPHGMKGDYLVYARTFELDKERKTTTLKLGLPGLLQ